MKEPSTTIEAINAQDIIPQLAEKQRDGSLDRETLYAAYKKLGAHRQHNELYNKSEDTANVGLLQPILESWINDEGRTFKDLQFALDATYFPDPKLPRNLTDYEKKTLVEPLRNMATSWLGHKGRTIEDLHGIVGLIKGNPRHPRGYFRDYLSKRDVATIWMSQEERSFEDLKTTLESIREVEDLYHQPLAETGVIHRWITQNGRSFKDLTNTIKLVRDHSPLGHEEPHIRVINSWISRKEGGFKDLEKVLKFLDKNEKWRASNLLVNKDQIGQEDLKKILKLFSDQEIRSSIAHTWIKENDTRTFEDLQMVTELLAKRTILQTVTLTKKSFMDDTICSLIRYWMGKSDNNFNPSELEKATSPLVENVKKSTVIAAWLGQKGNLEKIPANLNDLEVTPAFKELLATEVVKARQNRPTKEGKDGEESTKDLRHLESEKPWVQKVSDKENETRSTQRTA